MTNFPWRTALLVSLAFNLIVVSAVVGALASGARLERPMRDHAPMMRPMGGQAFSQALPPDARRRLRRELAGDVVATRAQREQAREARLAVFEAVRTDPYDADAVRAAFARVRAADAALAEPLHDAVARALGELPDAERRNAVAAVMEGPPGMRGGPRRGPPER